MLNNCTLAGRLTRDPELRHTQGGVPVCSFSIAVARDIKTDSGEKQTDFIECVSWRGAAECIAQYFTKGMMIIVCGRLQFRSWVDNDGNNRKAPEIVTERFYFAGDRRNTQGKGNAAESFTEPQMEEVEEDGDLPF